MSRGGQSSDIGRRKAHFDASAGGAQRAKVMPREKHKAQGTPQGTLAMSNVRVKKETNHETRVRTAGESSVTVARSTRQRDAVCQNISGRTVAVPVGNGGRGIEGILHGEYGALALLHQPASEHGRSVFFEPLIQEFSDLFAKICGVGQARELIGLVRDARCGEKKLPGGLGTKLRHKNLQRWGTHEYDSDDDTVVIYGNSAAHTEARWKRVVKQENALAMCSGCSGDYEDPDWSAWDEEDVEEEEVTHDPESDAEECVRGTAGSGANAVEGDVVDAKRGIHQEVISEEER